MSEVLADGVLLNPREELLKTTKPGMNGPLSVITPAPTDGVVEPLRGTMDNVRADQYGKGTRKGKKRSK